MKGRYWGRRRRWWLTPVAIIGAAVAIAATTRAWVRARDWRESLAGAGAVLGSPDASEDQRRAAIVVVLRNVTESCTQLRAIRDAGGTSATQAAAALNAIGMEAGR